MSTVPADKLALAVQAGVFRRLEKVMRQLDADTLTTGQLQILVGALEQVAGQSTRAERHRATLARPNDVPRARDLQQAINQFADRCAATAAEAEREAGPDAVAAAVDEVQAEFDRLAGGNANPHDAVATILKFPGTQ